MDCLAPHSRSQTRARSSETWQRIRPILRPSSSTATTTRALHKLSLANVLLLAAHSSTHFRPAVPVPEPSPAATSASHRLIETESRCKPLALSPVFWVQASHIARNQLRSEHPQLCVKTADLDRCLDLRAHRHRPETPQAGSESLPDFTDFQRYAIGSNVLIAIVRKRLMEAKKCPFYRYSSHPTPKTNPPMTPTN